ncbi:MAG: aconitate hydratase [Chloroflexi bacterium]|nr:aconitate hydratase [Chloroflexota bacterium]
MPSGPFDARSSLRGGWGSVTYYRLDALTKKGVADVDHLPFTVKVLLENVLRRCDGKLVVEDDVIDLARWGGDRRTASSSAGVPARGGGSRKLGFLPARVLLQDFTGVPAVVDLAALRSAMARIGGDPRRVNPLVPADLVIDHSVQVDEFGTVQAFDANVSREYERNGERYALLRWAQQAFDGFRVVPPGMGIVHQVNLEHLGSVVATRRQGGETVALPDTLVGTDSHTTMINGLGILGWGVGGIEAEAVLLGQPLYMSAPEVVGFRLIGQMAEGATATDLVLRVTELLRRHGVVNKFVEFTGPGLSSLSLPDRATISNMSPEFGATASLFPVDRETLRYLRDTGRDEALIELVERYTKEQGLFRTDETPEPRFGETLELDLGTIEPSLAGPRRPQDRVRMSELGRTFRATYPDKFAAPTLSQGIVQAQGIVQDAQEAQPHNQKDAVQRFDWEGGAANKSHEASPAKQAGGEEEGARDALLPCTTVQLEIGGVLAGLTHGSVVIAAITSCTNTSNPSVMIGAGLLAKNAVERGLMVKPWVKTSLAPGSRAVKDYLRDAGLMPYLEALHFHLVGFGCTTCIGNSGPLPQPVAAALDEADLVVTSVLSGNRNFDGRIHPQVRASYLASPPLVVAYAIAGTVDIDLTREPVGRDPNGQPVYLREIWPSSREINEAISRAVKPEIFAETYAHIMDGDERWRSLPVPPGDLYTWDATSTYVQEPPFFQGLSPEPPPVAQIVGARVLAALGDSVTTDHISPAGAIPEHGPAGRYLVEHTIDPRDFNSFGSRRGNHEVMVRGTFGNVRLRNALVPDREGDWTLHLPDGTAMRIFDAAMRYQNEGTPLLVLAGKEYGSGSSRDWAAKGPLLLGVRAVVAESYERIHRSNLVGMGILPLQFRAGESRATLGLTGCEIYDIERIPERIVPGQELTVRARGDGGGETIFQTIARIDNGIEAEYYRNGGVLQTVLRQMLPPRT